MLIAGRKHYVFWRPSDYSAVYKTKTLDIEPFIRMLYIKWFAFSEKEAITLGQRLKPQTHAVNNEILLRPEKNQVTATKYFIELDAQLRILDSELDRSNTKKLTRDGLTLVEDIQGKASTNAYFGNTPLRVNPNLMYDSRVFNKDGFWTLLISVPRFLFPKPYDARDRITSAMGALSDALDSGDSTGDNASPFIKARHKIVSEEGLSRNGKCSELFNIFFGYVNLLHQVPRTNRLA